VKSVSACNVSGIAMFYGAQCGAPVCVMSISKVSVPGRLQSI